MRKVAVLLATCFAHPWDSSFAPTIIATQVFPTQALNRRQGLLFSRALVFGAPQDALGVRTCTWLLLLTAVEVLVLIAEHYVAEIIPVLAIRTEFGRTV